MGGQYRGCSRAWRSPVRKIPLLLRAWSVPGMAKDDRGCYYLLRSCSIRYRRAEKRSITGTIHVSTRADSNARACKNATLPPKMKQCASKNRILPLKMARVRAKMEADLHADVMEVGLRLVALVFSALRCGLLRWRAYHRGA
eukprot:447548-Rhodomonas_salina.2